jgi:hypothetical protein
MPNANKKHSPWFTTFCLLVLLALYAAGGAAGGDGFRPAVAAPRQVTESVYVELAVADVEQATETVQWLARRYDGRIEDNYHWTEPGERWASITVLLPAPLSGHFYDGLATMGRVRAERHTTAAGSRYTADTRVTVLLVAPYAAARPVATAVTLIPHGEAPRPLATWHPPSLLRAVLAIASSIYQALIAITLRLADLAGRLLLAILAAFWLLWHARRRPPKDKSF